ncbi:unnamed protein product [Paramecium primaurelia]|uniref:EGF-like domain-containing protein n=1 Tax=Paramecium primaurelia TaxID=5886 RepID=A0A8S1LWQ6_PARPR|nr:unnamed protein product [Paramecium primaurelia]
MFLIVSAIQILLAHANWVMIDQSFVDGFTSNNSWDLSKYCDYFDNDQSFRNNSCQSNSIKYVRLKDDRQRMDKIYQQKSYQSEVIVDIFFDNAGDTSGNQAYFTLNLTQSSSSRDIMQQRNYIYSDLTQNARQICNSSTPQYFDFITYVGTSPVLYKEKFNISIGIETDEDNQILGVRNVFVYVKYCSPTCKTCSSSTSCLTCVYGSLQTDGSCTCDPSHQFAQTGIGCRQECERDYFIARSDNICVPDRRIKSLVSYFESTTFSAYSPFQFVQDSANSRSSPSLIFDCSSTKYVGSLLYSEGMSLQLATSQSLKFIRLRITFYLQGFLTNNRIQILLDDQIQGEIIKTSSDYNFEKIRKIYSQSVICTNTYDLIRIEAILRTYSNTPKLILKGSQLTQATSTWGFRNITIDRGNCKENCEVCADFSTCQQCISNYVLFQNGCVSDYPVHSANCVDYADMIPNSRYLAKGFYNFNMTTSDLNKFFDEIIPTGNNFLTQQKFSIFPTKFVLGGVMVWNNAIYKKSWSISKPHYAVTIRFNVIYGDQYAGNFYYTIQGVKSVAHPKPSTSGQNIIGMSLNEITQYFEIFQNPFTSSPLNIEFQCTDTTVDPRDQFCAISDYFIVVHYCLPFCQDCNDGVSCVTWESGHLNENCDVNQFLQFDSISETYNCITCNQPGCLTCKNLEECTSCDSSSQYNTLINGVCLPINPPSPPSPSLQCHKYCETCTGALITNCQTCVSDFHRILSNNQCLCQSGFYDDGINVICLPVCGDLLIVDGEDCDDGNSNPYDGCNDCKFGCDETCKECFWGICFDCQKGFQIADNQCVAICGDNLLVKTEECEDNNQTPNEGCYNCKFSCPNHCIDCQFNKCIKCDELNGWYLDKNICQPICGDGIVAIQLEQCDDKIQQEFNELLNKQFCFQCQQICQDSCSTCYKGECYQCNKGWVLNTIQKNCHPINGDKLVVGNEQCDDWNEIPYDGCYLSQYSCDQNCIDCQMDICYICEFGFYLNQGVNSCVSKCGDGLVAKDEQCDDGVDNGCINCQKQCQKECLSCYQGQCQECEGIGWEIDIVSGVCRSNCGDGIIVGKEQCDDGNEIEFDGCHQCELRCLQQQCTKCLIGICLECGNDGWYLFEYKCISFCGDLIVVDNEECDDGNIIPYDGCFECKFQCQIECTDCRSGICYECGIQGWHLINNYCEIICGDGIVVQDLEECDDGNFIQYDGCYQCQFQCSEMCTVCQQGICYECDYFGWMIDDHICKPFCGDGIITGNEQCDDMNNNQNDGCHQCQYACDEYCIDCQQGICQQCELGRFIVQNVCISQCGDGAYVKSAELCDDGNIQNGDGCDENCRIEDNYICQNREGRFSLCAYSKQPQFNVKLLSTNAEDFQDVQITFDQKMKYYGGDQDKLSQLIISSIIDMKDSQYDIVYQIIKSESKEEISDITILLKVNFNAPIERPQLKIQFLNDSFLSEYNLPLQQLTKTVQLNTPSVLNQNQINLAQSTVAYNEAVIYFLIGLSGLCLMTGSSELFWNLMDQLQYLSYIKYVNIRFPPNLNIYFEVFKLISIQPAISALKIDNLFNFIQQGENNQILRDDKFKPDDINIRFLDNFSSFIFCLITAYSGYFFFKITYMLLYQMQPYFLLKMNQTIAKGFYLIRKKFYKSSKEFHYNGILRVMMSNAYDISFAMTIQLSYFQSKKISETINSYLSLAIFASYLGVSIYIFNIMQKFSNKNTLRAKKQYESLFEGIQEGKNVWVSQYNTILLIKKLTFISIIVFMQTDGKLQTLLIAINQSLFLFFCIANNPLQSHYEYYKILITESLVIFNTITFILYDYSKDIGLNQNFSLTLGWVHISSFSAILIFSLIIDIFQQLQVMVIKLRQFCCQNKNQEDLGSQVRLFI